MTQAQKELIQSVKGLRDACDQTLTKLRSEQSPETLAAVTRSLLKSGGAFKRTNPVNDEWDWLLGARAPLVKTMPPVSDLFR